MGTTQYRSFIAWLPEKTHRGVLSAIGDSCLRTAGTVFRAVPPRNYHITGIFLGDLAEEELRRTADILKDYRKREPELFSRPLALKNLFPVPFPDARRPRVLVLAPEQSPATDHLLNTGRAGFLSALRAEGIAFDDRPLRPHLTLAYVKRQASAHDIREAFAAMPEFLLPVLDLEPAVLIHSTLQAGGSAYRVVV